MMISARNLIRLAVVCGVLTVQYAAADAGAAELGHPRLYMRGEDLPRLRAARQEGQRKEIWKNIRESADWCMTLSPRKEWIAPVSPDPIYENLYDRFYAIMADLAVTEHLAFTYALSGDTRYGDAARDWVLASCRVWKNEAKTRVDGGKAYAVCRLLKGVAVGYDLAHDRFTEAQRDEVRKTLVSIGQMYYKDYFTTPAKAGPGFSSHHAIVEWASFGVMALALLGEVPEAQAWLDATIVKFEKHLLPMGLAPDGAQTEGSTFWASTMHYRLFFMDALRRVTGRDLFGKYKQYMNADLALASIAAPKHPGYNQRSENVVLEPTYGQLDYYSPVLLFLARQYRRPIYQRLALWDHSLGHLQRSRYVTPTKKITMLIELGGYAYVWYDPSVSTDFEATKLSYHFPSVGEAYMRRSWNAGDLVVGLSGKRGLVVHAGGYPVLIEAAENWSDPPGNLPVQTVEDNGSVATITAGSGTHLMIIKLDRDQRQVTIRRQAPGADEWSWWCQGNPSRDGNTITWDDRVQITVREGSVTGWDPTGASPKLAVAGGLLKVKDPASADFPLVKVVPRKTEVVTEIVIQQFAEPGETALSRSPSMPELTITED